MESQGPASAAGCQPGGECQPCADTTRQHPSTGELQPLEGKAGLSGGRGRVSEQLGLAGAKSCPPGFSVPPLELQDWVCEDLSCCLGFTGAATPCMCHSVGLCLISSEADVLTFESVFSGSKENPCFAWNPPWRRLRADDYGCSLLAAPTFL